MGGDDDSLGGSPGAGVMTSSCQQLMDRKWREVKCGGDDPKEVSDAKTWFCIVE
jgi:hypothetical protein